MVECCGHVRQQLLLWHRTSSTHDSRGIGLDRLVFKIGAVLALVAAERREWLCCLCGRPYQVWLAVAVDQEPGNGCHRARACDACASIGPLSSSPFARVDCAVSIFK